MAEGEVLFFVEKDAYKTVVTPLFLWSEHGRPPLLTFTASDPGDFSPVLRMSVFRHFQAGRDPLAQLQPDGHRKHGHGWRKSAQGGQPLSPPTVGRIKAEPIAFGARLA